MAFTAKAGDSFIVAWSRIFWREQQIWELKDFSNYWTLLNYIWVWYGFGCGVWKFGMALVVEFEIHSYLSHSHIDHIGEAEEQSAHLGIAAKNRCWWRLGEV